MTALLQASGLSLPDRLRDSAIALRGGTLTCLVGPNGSGKTSLLHALAGIGRPHGQVRIDGIDPASLGPAQRRRLYAYLPASREVSWPLSARDLIALGAAEDDPDSIRHVLQRLDLAGMANRRIDLMSTGERSRVMIARALVAQPRVLLLDEPASNLDPLWQLRLMALLRDMARNNGQAMLVAVHDLELARDYADRLIIMSDRRIAADGDPHSLLTGPDIPSIFGIRYDEGRWRPLD